MKERTMGIWISVCVAFIMLVCACGMVVAHADEDADVTGDYRIQGYDNNSGDYIIAKYNVKDYGAVGDGVANDTAAFTKVFSELRRMSDFAGAVVYVPAGKYKITSSLTVPTNVALRGQWNNPKSGASGEESILLACMDPSESEQAAASSQGFIILNKHATITDMVIAYPDQSPDDIKPYPYSIYANAHMVSLRNITLVNSYFGVQLGATPDKGSAHAVQNIYGTVLKRGVNIDYNFSDGVVQDVGFSAAYWKKYDNLSEQDVEKIKAFTKENATAVYIGKNDDYIVSELDCPADEFKEVFSVNYNDGTVTTDGTPTFGYGMAMGLHGQSTIQNKPADYSRNPAPKDVDGVKGAENFVYQNVPDRFSTKHDVFNVKDYGATGKYGEDATFAIAAALEEAEKNGGGVVYLPAGAYQVSAPLTVPRNVELRGESEDFWMGEATHIDVNWGKGKPDEAVVFLTDNSGIQGISFRTPGLKQEGISQTVKTGEECMPQWAWMIRGGGANVWVENVEFYNVMQGIDFASHACDNFVIRGIYGTALQIGAAIGGGTKTGRIENFQMSFSLWYESEGQKTPRADFDAYVSHRMVGLTFGDCSDIIAYNAGGFALKHSMVFYEQDGKGPSNLIFYKILADTPFGHDGVLVESGNDISILGLSTGVNAVVYNGENVGTHLRVTDTFDGKLRVLVQNAWGSARNAIAEGKDVVVYGEGAQDTDMIEHNITFADYPDSFENYTPGNPDDQPEPPTQTKVKCGGEVSSSVFMLALALIAGACGLAALPKKKNG